MLPRNCDMQTLLINSFKKKVIATITLLVESLQLKRKVGSSWKDFIESGQNRGMPAFKC